MGTILASRPQENYLIRMRLVVNQEEALVLAGSMRNVHVFTEELSDMKAAVIEKGRFGTAKYFEIPKKLRQRSKRSSRGVQYLRMDTPSKAIFIYIVDRND
jgi:hypothetical protein